MDTKSRFHWPRQLFPLLLFILPLCGAARGQGVHLTMGNPSNAVTDTNQPANYLLSKSQYALSYHRYNGRPNWVSWHLDPTWLGNAPRQNDFRNDTTLPAGWYQVQGSDFSGSGFDRGHMCPSADRTATVNDNSATFLMTNMVAQLPATNQGPWADMDGMERIAGIGAKFPQEQRLGGHGGPLLEKCAESIAAQGAVKIAFLDD